MSSDFNIKRRYLPFEQPLQELDQQIAQLKSMTLTTQVDVGSEIKALEEKSKTLLGEIYSHLSPYQIVQISRHPNRPTALDYIDFIFEDFIPLHGDRGLLEDRAIVGGLAQLEGRPLMILANQKGKNTSENMLRNFGMPRPEGYRKAKRLMTMAERFGLPIVTLIDTPGAYPGLEAEERGQALAIADNIISMTDLRTPIVSVVLGEGGSGGALAMAVADRLLMLEFSTYSVISPEGCAAITWKDAAFAADAADALKLTSKEILKSKVADQIIPEPLGGAHRDFQEMAQRLKEVLASELRSLGAKPKDVLIEERYQRYRALSPIARVKA